MANTAYVRIARKSRHERLRKKVSGTDARPRLCVYRSLKYIYAQLLDDVAGCTMLSVSSLNPEIKARSGSKTDDAKIVGETIGKKAREKGFEQVVFDRGGFKYHGRVKALADAAREAGLKF